MARILTALTLILGALAPPAWAGHVYINPASCQSLTTEQFTGATRLETTGVAHQYVSFNFINGLNENDVMVCHFFMPADNATYAFQVVAHIRGSESTDGNPMVFGTSMVVNVDGSNYNDIDPHLLGSTGKSTIVSSDLAPTTGGQTGTTTISSSPAWTLVNATAHACIDVGTTCQNREVILWAQRITTNAVCSDAFAPYQCCTGIGTGTCAPSPGYFGNVEVLGLDLSY